MVLISSETSTVAADLEAIDPRLKIRWCENGNPPYFAVYHAPEGGCPCPDPNCEHGDLVLTARQCDDRIVQRVREINPEGPGRYDYTKALEQRRKARERTEKHERDERNGELAEQVAHAVRKDLGLGPYKGRIFKPREI